MQDLLVYLFILDSFSGYVPLSNPCIKLGPYLQSERNIPFPSNISYIYMFCAK